MTDHASDSPYGQHRPAEDRSAEVLLQIAALLAVVVGLVGIFLLFDGGLRGGVGTEDPAADRVSRLVYPASLVEQTGQPTNGQWLLPAAAVTVDSATFVLDTGNNRILKLNGAGRIVARLDGSSDERLVLRQPMAMTIASDGLSLLVANSLAAEVLVLDLSGRVEKVISLRAATADGDAIRPIGVAATSDGGIIVSDAGNHRVLRLDGDGRVLWSAGTGTRAGGSDGFNVPGALKTDGAGNIYVVDTLNGRVVKLSPDGTFVRQFGRLGAEAGTLSRPKGVAVDAEGRVFVSDGLLAAVQVFSPDGTYLGLIGRRDPTDPASDSLFQAPASLWLAGDRLYVMDRIAGLITLRLTGAPSS